MTTSENTTSKPFDLVQELERLLGVRGPGGLVAEILEELGREPAHLDVVLDHQHPPPAALRRYGRRLAGLDAAAPPAFRSTCGR